MEKPPSPDLYDRIITDINREHKIALLKRRLFFYASCLAASFLILLPLAKNLYGDLIRSDFLEISSLVFTDFGLVMSNLSDFTLSALESAPLFNLTVTGLFLVALLYSASKLLGLTREFKKLNNNLI